VARPGAFLDSRAASSAAARLLLPSFNAPWALRTARDLGGAAIRPPFFGPRIASAASVSARRAAVAADGFFRQLSLALPRQPHWMRPGSSEAHRAICRKCWAITITRAIDSLPGLCWTAGSARATALRRPWS